MIWMLLFLVICPPLCTSPILLHTLKNVYAIVRAFTSRDARLLMRAFLVYVFRADLELPVKIVKTVGVKFIFNTYTLKC